LTILAGVIVEMVDYSKFYKHLKKEKKQLAERLEQWADDRRSPGGREGSPFGKREEEANDAFELEKGLALEEKLRNTLTGIGCALEKYEAGTYGLCDSCGRPIEMARLEALPWANLCLECKTSQANGVKETK